MSTYNNDETEIHVGLSSGEFYVLNLLLEELASSGDNDDDGSSFPWWAYLLIGSKK